MASAAPFQDLSNARREKASAGSSGGAKRVRPPPLSGNRSMNPTTAGMSGGPAAGGLGCGQPKTPCSAFAALGGGSRATGTPLLFSKSPSFTPKSAIPPSFLNQLMREGGNFPAGSQQRLGIGGPMGGGGDTQQLMSPGNLKTPLYPQFTSFLDVPNAPHKVSHPKAVVESPMVPFTLPPRTPLTASSATIEGPAPIISFQPEQQQQQQPVHSHYLFSPVGGGVGGPGPHFAADPFSPMTPFSMASPICYPSAQDDNAWTGEEMNE